MGDGGDKSTSIARDSAVGRSAATNTSAPAVGKQSLVQLAQDDGAVAGTGQTAAKKPNITGYVIAGGPLSDADIDAINTAAKSVPAQFKHYVAYADHIKVGGSLAWRANNPGNLRDASTKIGKVPGASGTFAVFATMDDGHAAQRDLYETKYGSSTVQAAIEKLTPSNENDTAGYLKKLENAGVKLDQTVSSQIDLLMSAVKANEGMIPGTDVPRSQ